MTPTNWAKAFSTSLAQEIRICRENQGLSKKKLAEQSGLAPHYIGYIETLERCPTVDTLARIAHGLGRKPSELVIKAEKAALKSGLD